MDDGSPRIDYDLSWVNELRSCPPEKFKRPWIGENVTYKGFVFHVVAYTSFQDVMKGIDPTQRQSFMVKVKSVMGADYERLYFSLSLGGRHLEDVGISDYATLTVHIWEVRYDFRKDLENPSWRKT